MRIIIFIFSLLLTISNEELYAQYSFKGRITDLTTQEPLKGVSVKSENNLIQTTTDTKGDFVFETPSKKGILIISYIGYTTIRIDLSRAEQTLNIQMENNGVQLNEVIVTGYGNEKRLQDVAGSVALISSKDFQRANTFSIKPVLDLVPGVRVDQSNLSETRISIRGVGVRSAFGNRNLKFYINDIPITEADGFTRIEGIDIATLGKAEVIKGPASSIYGFGTGGVINFQTQKASYNENSLEGETMVGSYGFRRVSSTYRYGTDKLNLAATYGWQDYEGYRKHNNDVRRFITANLQLFPSEKQIVNIFLNRTEQISQIPGSLNINQINQDRKQANPGNVTNNAGRNQIWTRIGISHQYNFSSTLSNSTSLFTSFFDLDHPLSFAYIRSGYQSYGGRTRFIWKPSMKKFATKLIWGGEYLNGISRQTRYVNNQGKEGNIIFNSDNNNTQYSLFAQTETKLLSKLILTMGASYNHISYTAKDYLVNARSGTLLFEPQITPRVALSYLIQQNHSLHISVSKGFAPPTGGEVLNADGTINQNIQPEIGTNYEFNAKGDILHQRLSYDLSIYRFNLQDELIPQTIAQNLTIFNNAGKTFRNGIELGLYWDALKNKESFLSLIRPFTTITYSDFRFENYKIRNAQNIITSDFSGNALTGITPWVINAGIDIESKYGAYIFGTYFYNDRMPMNDGNTDFNEAYQVFNVKIGYRKKFKRMGVNIYAGADNLLNEKYSSQIALNARSFTNQPIPYFNPSPETMWYGGLSIKYFFIK